jgi:lipid-A-disaccharide synthase
VVPERVGEINPDAIAEEANQWLANPQQLQAMAEELRQLRGKPGAVNQLAEMVNALLPTESKARA